MFTETDLDKYWPYHKEYLLEILNGEYSVETAREDLQSFIDADKAKEPQHSDVWLFEAMGIGQMPKFPNVKLTGCATPESKVEK